MFTGIIEQVGKVTNIEEKDYSEPGATANYGWTITIGHLGTILEDCHQGDSICVNGTCLTVTTFTKTEFKVGVMQQTLRMTNLGQLRLGDSVNLERAMLSTSRMGGHFVQGHVDTTCVIQKIEPDGNALMFTFTLQDDLVKYIVAKGYVALDGISLTVVDVGRDWFKICMIAYTQQCVGLALKKVGDSVNVEVDMLGKYVDKILGSVLMLDSSSGTEMGNGGLSRHLEAFIERKVNDILERQPSN